MNAVYMTREKERIDYLRLESRKRHEALDRLYRIPKIKVKKAKSADREKPVPSIANTVLPACKVHAKTPCKVTFWQAPIRGSYTGL